MFKSAKSVWLWQSKYRSASELLRRIEFYMVHMEAIRTGQRLSYIEIYIFEQVRFH